MRTLDRYIIRQYVVNFVILTFAVLSLFVLVDLVLDFDEFIEVGRAGGPGFIGQAWATVGAIVGYYYPMVLLLYIYIAGLAAVAAMGFTVSNLVSSGELTAMVAGGISMYRIAAPLMVVGAIFVGLALPDQEFVIPHLADRLARGKSDVKNRKLQKYQVQFVADENKNLLSAEDFDVVTGRLTGVTYLKLVDGRANERYTAESAVWDKVNEGWQLTGGRVLMVSGNARGSGTFEPVPTAAATFIATSLTPDVLRAKRASIYPRLLSLTDLQEMANNPSADRETITRIMHGRFSWLVVNVLAMAMVLPFFMVREPTNMLLQGARAMMLCLGVWGGAVLMLQMGWQHRPLVAAWFPVIFYLPVCAVMLQRVKT